LEYQRSSAHCYLGYMAALAAPQQEAVDMGFAGAQVVVAEAAAA
jgi:hypothetical protein